MRAVEHRDALRVETALRLRKDLSCLRLQKKARTSRSWWYWNDARILLAKL